MEYNNLMLKRLVIITNDGNVAYDEKFHEGINIIRGQNSSGKSTIAHFIFYVLGASFKNWVAEVMCCRCVYGEIEFNGHVICLKRDIQFEINSNNSPRYNDKMPIDIFYGTYDETITSTEENKWLRYGYSTTPNMKSFSTELFSLFGFPIVRADNYITMHQLLRLMYIDQISPTSSYFYFEPFDSELTRTTVSDLLLGCYDEDLYDAKVQLNQKESELSEVKGKLKSMRNTVPNENLDESNINTQIINLLQEIGKIEEDIVTLKNNRQYTRLKDKDAYMNLTLQIATIRNQLSQTQSNRNMLLADIDDSSAFIDAIKKKLEGIKQSIRTRNALHDFQLSYCPEWLSPLEEVADNVCRLCKSPLPEKNNIHRIMNMKTEYEFQMMESLRLLKNKQERLSILNVSIENLNSALKKKKKEAMTLAQLNQTSRDENIDNMLKAVGEKNSKIEILTSYKKIARLYSELLKKEEKLIVEQTKLADFINRHQAQLNQRKEKITAVVEKFSLNMLHNDEKRENLFKEAEHIDINFKNNIVYIPGARGGFSASSEFLLKLASRYALFLASLNIETMRYPRFILCDNMEDKGMEPDRAQAFQHSLINLCEQNHTKPFQVIYATSMLPLDLEGTEYCVGEFYSADNKTLKHVN